MARKGAKPEDTERDPSNVKVQQISNSMGIPVGQFVAPGSIEAMEAEGQRQLVASESIPFRFNGGERAENEALMTKWGFELGSQHKEDTLFRWTNLPSGWKRAATDHSMWSKIVDENGKERVSIFYKAVFYDREAFMSLVSRFCLRFSHDIAALDAVDPVTAGYDIVRLPMDMQRVREDRVNIYTARDEKHDKVLGVFVGGDYEEVRKKAVAFMKERIGEDYGNPARWDDP